MKKITLSFETKEGMFTGKFTGMPKEFIQELKNKGFLKRVRENFINMLPDVFDGEIQIDPDANTQTNYSLFFYLDVKATDEMKLPVQEFLSRDIGRNEDSGFLEFVITVPRSLKIIKESKKKIEINF